MTGARLGFQDSILARACAAEGTAGSLAFQAWVVAVLGPQRAGLGAGLVTGAEAAGAESWSATGPEPQLEKDVMRIRAPVGPLSLLPLLFRLRQQHTAQAGAILHG